MVKAKNRANLIAFRKHQSTHCFGFKHIALHMRSQLIQDSNTLYMYQNHLLRIVVLYQQKQFVLCAISAFFCPCCGQA